MHPLLPPNFKQSLPAKLLKQALVEHGSFVPDKTGDLLLALCHQVTEETIANLDKRTVMAGFPGYLSPVLWRQVIELSPPSSFILAEALWGAVLGGMAADGHDRQRSKAALVNKIVEDGVEVQGQTGFLNLVLSSTPAHPGCQALAYFAMTSSAWPGSMQKLFGRTQAAPAPALSRMLLSDGGEMFWHGLLLALRSFGPMAFFRLKDAPPPIQENSWTWMVDGLWTAREELHWGPVLLSVAAELACVNAKELPASGMELLAFACDRIGLRDPFVVGILRQRESVWERAGIGGDTIAALRELVLRATLPETSKTVAPRPRM